MQLGLDVSIDTYGYVLCSLLAFDAVWLVGFNHNTRLVTSYRVVTLLVYLNVTYALSVGTTPGEYGRSIAWGAGVAAVVWGSFNGAMLAVSSNWSGQQAWKDVVAGIVKCVIACAFAAAAGPAWTSIIPVCIVLVLIMYKKSRPNDYSGLHERQLVVVVGTQSKGPCDIFIWMDGREHRGKVSQLSYQYVVKLGKGPACSAENYVDAVAEAVRALDPNNTGWVICQRYTNESIPRGITFDGIIDGTYNKLKVTHGPSVACFKDAEGHDSVITTDTGKLQWWGNPYGVMQLLGKDVQTLLWDGSILQAPSYKQLVSQIVKPENTEPLIDQLKEMVRIVKGEFEESGQPRRRAATWFM